MPVTWVVGPGVEAERAGCSLSLLIGASLIGSSAQPSFQVSGNISREKITLRNTEIFSLLCRHLSRRQFLSAQTFGLAGSLWYAFPRAHKEKINKELVTSGGAKVAKSWWGSSSSFRFWQRGRECQWKEITLLVVSETAGLVPEGIFWAGSQGLLRFCTGKAEGSFCQQRLTLQGCVLVGAFFFKKRKSITHLKLAPKRYMDFLWHSFSMN